MKTNYNNRFIIHEKRGKMSQIQNRTDNNGNRQKIEKKTPGEFNLGEVQV